MDGAGRGACQEIDGAGKLGTGWYLDIGRGLSRFESSRTDASDSMREPKCWGTLRFNHPFVFASLKVESCRGVRTASFRAGNHTSSSRKKRKDTKTSPRYCTVHVATHCRKVKPRSSSELGMELGRAGYPAARLKYVSDKTRREQESERGLPPSLPSLSGLSRAVGRMGYAGVDAPAAFAPLHCFLGDGSQGKRRCRGRRGRGVRARAVPDALPRTKGAAVSPDGARTSMMGSVWMLVRPWVSARYTGSRWAHGAGAFLAVTVEMRALSGRVAGNTRICRCCTCPTKHRVVSTRCAGRRRYMYPSPEEHIELRTEKSIVVWDVRQETRAVWRCAGRWKISAGCRAQILSAILRCARRPARRDGGARERTSWLLCARRQQALLRRPSDCPIL
ncbi:hypothetical protein FB451DRAFT_1440976 [Mycena latifolia]|nr:hypothetical protein FB451DRAFT_1440976 [Mycena latifolia]